MAMTTIPDWWVPQPVFLSTLGGITISGADTKAGLIVTAPKPGNIRTIYFALGTVTTGATLDVRVETISSGTPSGTLVNANANGACVVADTDDNTIKTVTLTADAVVTGGLKIGIVISNPNASPGNMVVNGTAAFLTSQYPYGGVHNGVSWSITGVAVPTITLGYDDGSIVPLALVWPPCTAITGTTDPDNFGVKFKFPVAVRVRGCWYTCDQDGSSLLRLVTTAYNEGAGTGILATTATITSSDRPGVGNSSFFALTFDTRVDLTANTYYRLTWQPVSGSGMDLAYRNTLLAAMPGAWSGAEFFKTTATNPTGDGDWTDTTNDIPAMGLLIDGIDTSGGSTSGGSFTFA